MMVYVVITNDTVTSNANVISACTIKCNRYPKLSAVKEYFSLGVVYSVLVVISLSQCLYILYLK
jgi:hypothetical protein